MTVSTAAAALVLAGFLAWVRAVDRTAEVKPGDPPVHVRIVARSTRPYDWQVDEVDA